MKGKILSLLAVTIFSASSFAHDANSNDILEAKRKVILADENYNWEKEVKILSNF